MFLRRITMALCPMVLLLVQIVVTTAIILLMRWIIALNSTLKRILLLNYSVRIVFFLTFCLIFLSRLSAVNRRRVMLFIMMMSSMELWWILALSRFPAIISFTMMLCTGRWSSLILTLRVTLWGLRLLCSLVSLISLDVLISIYTRAAAFMTMLASSTVFAVMPIILITSAPTLALTATSTVRLRDPIIWVLTCQVD